MRTAWRRASSYPPGNAELQQGIRSISSRGFPSPLSPWFVDEEKKKDTSGFYRKVHSVYASLSREVIVKQQEDAVDAQPGVSPAAVAPDTTQSKTTTDQETATDSPFHLEPAEVKGMGGVVVVETETGEELGFIGVAHAVASPKEYTVENVVYRKEKLRTLGSVVYAALPVSPGCSGRRRFPHVFVHSSFFHPSLKTDPASNNLCPYSSDVALFVKGHGKVEVIKNATKLREAFLQCKKKKVEDGERVSVITSRGGLCSAQATVDDGDPFFQLEGVGAPGYSGSPVCVRAVVGSKASPSSSSNSRNRSNISDGAFVGMYVSRRNHFGRMGVEGNPPRLQLDDSALRGLSRVGRIFQRQVPAQKPPKPSFFGGMLSGIFGSNDRSNDRSNGRWSRTSSIPTDADRKHNELKEMLVGLKADNKGRFDGLEANIKEIMVRLDEVEVRRAQIIPSETLDLILRSTEKYMTCSELRELGQGEKAVETLSTTPYWIRWKPDSTLEIQNPQVLHALDIGTGDVSI